MKKVVGLLSASAVAAKIQFFTQNPKCGPISNPDLKVPEPTLPLSLTWDISRDADLNYYLNPKWGAPEFTFIFIHGAGEYAFDRMNAIIGSGSMNPKFGKTKFIFP